MLDPEPVRMVQRVAHLGEHAGPLRELQRRPDLPELEALDVFHDDQRGIAVTELEDPDDAPVGEKRHGARFLEESGDARHRPIAADDLAGDDAIEGEVFELVDLAHPAAADALDGLESVERRQGRRRGRPGSHGRARDFTGQRRAQ